LRVAAVVLSLRKGTTLEPTLGSIGWGAWRVDGLNAFCILVICQFKGDSFSAREWDCLTIGRLITSIVLFVIVTSILCFSSSSRLVEGSAA